MYVPLPHLTAKDAACTTSPLSAPGNAGGFLLPGGPTCPPTRPCPASPPTWTASPPPSAGFHHVVRNAFVPDLRTGRFRPGLRVKRVRQAPGVYELSWSMGAPRRTRHMGIRTRALPR
ncbi:hypothetical protein ACFQ3Z_44900 [Streptomyces nogalater]